MIAPPDRPGKETCSQNCIIRKKQISAGLKVQQNTQALLVNSKLSTTKKMRVTLNFSRKVQPNLSSYNFTAKIMSKRIAFSWQKATLNFCK